MKIKGFNHIGINIIDFDKSIAFYCGVLGLKLQETVKMDDCSITYLVLNDGNRIELFDYNGKNKAYNAEETQVGYRHIAIEVDNVDDYERLLMENNIPIVLNATDIPSLGVRVLLFADPNGVVMEFCQPL